MKVPFAPGVVALREEQVSSPVLRAEVSNTRAADIQLELRLPSLEGARIVRADHELGSKNGRPTLFAVHEGHENQLLHMNFGFRQN